MARRRCALARKRRGGFPIALVGKSRFYPNAGNIVHELAIGPDGEAEGDPEESIGRQFSAKCDLRLKDGGMVVEIIATIDAGLELHAIELDEGIADARFSRLYRAGDADVSHFGPNIEAAGVELGGDVIGPIGSRHIIRTDGNFQRIAGPGIISIGAGEVISDGLKEILFRRQVRGRQLRLCGNTGCKQA